MAEEDEWTRAEWEEYVRTQYKTLLAAKFSTGLDARSTVSTEISTVVTDRADARGAYWCACTPLNSELGAGGYRLADNYINDVRYSLSGSNVSRDAAVLEDTNADSTGDTVIIAYEISDLQINPSSDYDNLSVRVRGANGTAYSIGVAYGSYAPCAYLQANYSGNCDLLDGTSTFCLGSGLREGSCEGNYATYVFPGTESDGSIVIDTHPQCVRYSTTNTYDVNKAYIVIGNPIVPDDPDDPDVPVDPEDPDNPGDYSQIAYLTLDTNQVILTNEQIQAVPSKVICEFALDFEESTNYSPMLYYPIIACPVTYSENGCSSESIFDYSDPQSIKVDVGYSNSDLYNAILKVYGPASCNTVSDEAYMSKALSGGHVAELDLRSSAGSSIVKFDGHELIFGKLNGALNRCYDRPLVLAIGGYVCGNGGYVQYDCVGERRIQRVSIEGGSSDGTVELLPVVDSSGREGLRNTKTGHIVYPMTAAGYGGYYIADYIILNSNAGIALNAQVASSSVVTVTFKVPEESSLGSIPLLSLRGTVDSELTTLDVAVDTFVGASGTATRSITHALFNDATGPDGMGFANRQIDLDSEWHTYTIDFDQGEISLDGEVIAANFPSLIADFSSLQWDRPNSGEYPILVGENRLSQTSVSGTRYIAISKVEVSDAYYTSIDYDTGLAEDLSVSYYLPALTRNYVACLIRSSIDEYPGISPGTFHANYSIPGYSIHAAGLYRLPGSVI